MIPRIKELLTQMVFLTKDVQSNKSDIKELQKQVESLTNNLQRMAFEVQRNKDNETHEREKLMLRLENILLRSEHKMLLPNTEQDNRDSQIAALERENTELRQRLAALENRTP